MDSNRTKADLLATSSAMPQERTDEQLSSESKPVYFSCGQCGECCSSWNIPVEGPKARHLLKQPWVQERLGAIRQTLKLLGNDLYRIPLTRENVCVFLGDDKRCLVEVNEGPDAKPHECRRFPFATVRLSDEHPKNSPILKHETSAACKHISDKLLLAFSPILPHPEGSSAKINESEILLHSECPSHVSVQGWIKAPWSQSEDWRDTIKAIFKDDSLTPGEALWQAYRSFPDTKKSSSASLQRSALIPLWKEWLVTTFFLRKPYRTYSSVQLILGRHYEDSKLFGVPIDLRARRQIRWEPEEDRLVKAFLYNVLCRRLPLIRGQSLLSLWAMTVCAWLLMRWYAITLASLRLPLNGKTDDVISVSGDDISLAIRLTERYYTGHQPHFIHWFTKRVQAELLAHWIIH